MHFPNSFYDRTSTTTPVVGMGATEVWYSDRKACTVTRISASGKTFWMKHDIKKRIDKNGMSESQQYEFTSNPDAYEIRVSLRKDGSWKSTGGQRVWLGVRDHYHDYSF